MNEKIKIKIINNYGIIENKDIANLLRKKYKILAKPISNFYYFISIILMECL